MVKLEEAMSEFHTTYREAMVELAKHELKEGVKHDQNKPRLDLIPPEAIMALGEVLDYGAKKYGEHNWLKGMSWGRVFGAALRHLFQFWAGEDRDKESGLCHLHHAFANIAFLITYRLRGNGEDDRYKPPS